MNLTITQKLPEWDSEPHWGTIKPGDIIGFSGDSWVSATINIATYGIPYWDLSHVGIVAEYDVMWDGPGREYPYSEFRHRHHELLLFESTFGCPMPCEILGKVTSGVQAHPIAKRIEQYGGKVWHYPLYRELRPLETRRMTAFLLEYLGRNYDWIGAVRAAGRGFSWLESRLRREDLSSLFCSEYCAGAHKHINLLDTHSASRWSPNLLTRVERRCGILLKPRRLK